MRWSLDELYTSFDSKEYKDDFDKLESLVDELNKKYASIEEIGGPKEVLESFIEDYSKTNSLLRKLAAFSSLTMNVEAHNQKALRGMDRINNLIPRLTGPTTNFKIYLKDLENLDEVINSSDLLKEHEFFLNETYESTKYMLSENEEILLSKLSNTGSDAWREMQAKITSLLMIDVEVDGKVENVTLPVLRNLAFSPNPKTRLDAYEAELNAYKQVDEASAAALNSIKGEVITVSKARGYKSPLEETLIQSRMSQETLDAMFTAIYEYLPEFHRYLKKKAEILGHDGGLPFYDIFAPVGESNTSFTYPEAMEYIVKNFRTFSDELGDFAENAYEKNWLDVEPRQGKRGGAFCSNLHPIGESRIMSNFTGTFSDMITLAHELGHGYHGSVLKDEKILNTSYPMPLAETASIFCETIVTNAALKTASSEEELTILESSLQDATQVIVDILSRYIFETNLFKERADYSLSVEELNNLMVEAQKEAFGDGLDHDKLHPYMWLNKTHYYSAGRNFYNFPYAFGLLFAKGLYAQYLEEGDSFVSKYDDILRETGKNNIEDVTKMAGIDITDPDFFRSSLEIIKKDIDRFIELADK